jgi:putative colanic acid biosynthesis glycosyltransferase WcaI
VKQGHDVTVLASRRGYDDPSVCFKRRETWRGIDIIRIPTLGFGKRSKWSRSLDFASYLVFCFFRLMFLPRQDLTVALTSPPLISFFGALFAQLRGGRFCFWVMDLNPDEAVALGWLREDSFVTRILQAFLNYSLQRSDKIIALDRFMWERIVDKGVSRDKVVVVPPWSHDEDIRYDEAGRAVFRATHGLEGKFVVMYSGNHSPCHSLHTLVKAAWKLRECQNIMFCFVGGGSEYQKIKAFARENSLQNVLCLPYQPRNQLSSSLSAADLHVVVMGDGFKGVVHPCKIYNIMNVGAPILYIGPEESHITDLFEEHASGIDGRSARHGAVDEVAGHIQAAAAAGQIRAAGAKQVASQFSSHILLPHMISILEQLVQKPVLLRSQATVRIRARREG